MSANKEITTTRTSFGRLVWYSAGLSTLLMLLTLYPAAENMLAGLGGHKVLKAIADDSSSVRVLLPPFAFYAVALLVLHLLVGATALALMQLSTRAFPHLAAKRGSVLLLWFIALAVLIVSSNAAIFPRSQLAWYYHDLVTARIGPIRIFELYAIALAGVVLFSVGRLILRTRQHPRRWPVPLVVAAIALCGSTWALLQPVGTSRAVPSSAQPHVIILGVDSLRTDLLERFGGDAPLPNLNSQLAGAYLFRDTTTPLARTFPSWVSILTGRHPRESGALFNLMPRESLRVKTLAHELALQGYSTVFATDEVRFANIDAMFGFQKLVAPRIGATDFILGTLNDVPLANLVANTRAGAWLFPDTHANRAAATRYFPDVFVDRLQRDVSFDKPTFLAVHLTAAHWPYHDAHADLAEKHRSTFSHYLYGAGTADAQLGQIMDWLERSGVLENAIVWFVSDHGEAMGRRGDRLFTHQPPAPKIFVATAGHGTSVLSPSQFQVLLALRAYGRAAGLVPPGESKIPSSLEDLVPTTLDLLGIKDRTLNADGRALTPIIRGGVTDTLTGRVRFTETDFNLPRILAGDINPAWLAMKSVAYYRVNPKSGWIELKPDKLDDLMHFKERAAIGDEWVLAALPTIEDETLYVYAHRRDGTYGVLEGAPDEHSGELLRLWDALHSRFEGELGPPRAVSKLLDEPHGPAAPTT